MAKLTALLIDDDHQFCQSFKSLSQNIFDLSIAYSGKMGLEMLKESTPQVVLLDFKLGRGINGLEVLKKIKENYPDLPVIMITDYADVDTAVKAMKLGALHFTSKSPNILALKMIIEHQLEQLNWKLLFQEKFQNEFERIVTKSPVMQSLYLQIKQIARANTTVLIEGESGSGKEITAREIHHLSSRKNKPFVAINCSTLQPQLFESEFFGYEKGAFTGAVSQKKGKLEMAHTGTIFLDEISDLPLESQPKILRAIEEKSFQRLGSTKNQYVDVRIIAASNKNIQQLVKENKFREDLYYRLSVLTIFIPPLRERKEDIPILAEIFLKKFAHEMNKQIPQLTPEAIQKLLAYHWPGNIRELKNLMERLIVLNNNKIIKAQHIIFHTLNDSFQYSTNLLDLPYEQAKQTLLNNFKIAYFKRALQKYNGNVSLAAQNAGINRSSLHKILSEIKMRNSSLIS